MSTSKSHHDRMAELHYNSVYPHYVQKVTKKGRTEEELLSIISWLTGYSQKELVRLSNTPTTFIAFFDKATLHPDAEKIKGMICGYRIEDIEIELTRKIRYLDKIVDELSKGKSIEKITNRK